MNDVLTTTLKAVRMNTLADSLSSAATTVLPNHSFRSAFELAVRKAGPKNFTFHDLRHTFGTRLADAGVDVVKIKELMGHSSIVTTMRYIHATDKGKRGAITVLSEYRQQHCRKIVTNEKRQVLQAAANR